jgi:hypothetical protein
MIAAYPEHFSALYKVLSEDLKTLDINNARFRPCFIFNGKVFVYTFTFGGHEIVNSLTVTISIR